MSYLGTVRAQAENKERTTSERLGSLAVYLDTLFRSTGAVNRHDIDRAICDIDLSDEVALLFCTQMDTAFQTEPSRYIKDILGGVIDLCIDLRVSEPNISLL